MACSTVTSVDDFVTNGKKIIGLATNYRDVVKAKDIQVPKVPLVFLKPTTSYLQEGQSIIYPKAFSTVAFEVELGVIISKRCKNVCADKAMEYVGGYCLAMDLTAQCMLSEARVNGHPWTLGKGFDTSTPVSRIIQTHEIKDPHQLQIWLKVNGEVKQNGCTSNMIFRIPEQIEYISKYMTLEPNDLILTGTCDGAAPFEVGDTIECGLGDHVQMKFSVCPE